MKLTRIPHLDGDLGVGQTIRHMRRLIEQGKKDPVVHELAARILRKANVQSFEWEGEARAIFEAARRNLRFTRDVSGHETLHGAADIIRLGIADCDDFTVLICSLLQTIGADCRIVTIATDPDGEFCHVYPEVILPDGRAIAMDAARKAPAFGKSPEHYTRKRVWPLDSEGYADMRGLSRMGEGRTSIAPGEGPRGAWTARVYPPFRIAVRGMTGSYLDRFPVAPPHQQFKRPPIGLGNYGRAAGMRALGHLSDIDWSAITQAIQAGTTGAANIITAERASPYNLVPTTSFQAGGPTRMLQPVVPTPIGGISTNTLLIGGLILVGVMAMEGRR